MALCEMGAQLDWNLVQAVTNQKNAADSARVEAGTDAMVVDKNVAIAVSGVLTAAAEANDHRKRCNECRATI